MRFRDVKSFPVFFFPWFYKNDYSQHRFLISFLLVIFHDVSHIRSEIFSMQFRSCAQLAAEKKEFLITKGKRQSVVHIFKMKKRFHCYCRPYFILFSVIQPTRTYNNENKNETTWRCHDPMNERAKGQSIGTRSKELNVVILYYSLSSSHNQSEVRICDVDAVVSRANCVTSNEVEKEEEKRKEEEPQGKMKVDDDVKFCAATVRPRRADTLRSSWQWTETFGIVCPGFTQPNSVKRRLCYRALANEPNGRPKSVSFSFCQTNELTFNKVNNSCCYCCCKLFVFLQGVAN